MENKKQSLSELILKREEIRGKYDEYKMYVYLYNLTGSNVKETIQKYETKLLNIHNELKDAGWHW